MKAKEISVNVSKKVGRAGEYASDMISASITISVDENDDVDMAYVSAWASCWGEIDKQTKVLQEKVEEEKTSKKSESWLNESPVVQDDTPKCSVCGKPLTYKSGTSKTNNKPYKGWFCEDKTHPVVWVK